MKYADEPGYGFYDLNFDRAAHVGKYRRSYAANRSLYIPFEPWSPPIVNMQGSATEYLPEKEAEFIRRGAKTDRKAYLRELARSITASAKNDAEKVRLIAGFLNHALYFNPIQQVRTQDPVAILESHDGRCGQLMLVTTALLDALGIPNRATEVCHHVVTEAEYEGGWHIVDAFFFSDEQPHRDGRVLSVAELQADPFFVDSFPQECFVFDPETMMSEDGFWVEGYVVGMWGAEPYYSYYLGAEKEHPPTLPMVLPAQRTGKGRVRLNWSKAIKYGGGAVEYDVRVYRDRACTDLALHRITRSTSLPWKVEEQNRMYFIEVRALDDHRAKNPDTWYPAARGNFVFVPEDQYGWYGVL